MTATIGRRTAGSTEPGGGVAVVTTDGHGWTWIELFETFAPPIRSFARSRGVRGPDDVVQDVFVAAVEKLHHFQGDRAGLRSLFFTIAYRRINDEYRRLFRRPEILVSTHAPVPDSGPAVEDLVSSRDSVDHAIRALSVLSARERNVLEMRILREKTPAQVAAVIGISSGNVRVIQARALAKIRIHLESSSGEGAVGTRASWTMLFAATFRHLRAELPTDGGLAQWIEDFRRASAGPGGSTSAITGGAVLGDTVLGSAVASLGTAALTHSVIAKLTMIATLALATIGSGVVVTGSDTSAPVLAVVAAGSAVPTHHPGRGAERISEEPSSVSAPVDNGETVPAQILPSEGAAGIDPAADPPSVESPGGGVGEVVGPVVDDVVGPVGDDVVDPVVGVVGVVGGVVDDVVGPVGDDVVDPAVEGVGPVVDDVVGPVVGDVVDPVVRAVSGLVGPGADVSAVPHRDEGLDDVLGSAVAPILHGLLGG